MLARAIVLSILAFSVTAKARCIPQTKKAFPLVAITGLSLAEYNSAIDLVEKVYAPIVSTRGAQLNIMRLWSTAEVNSDAYEENGQYIIRAFGGLARYASAKVKMTVDAEVLVLCHEMGHHLGGAPKFSDPDGSWAAVEGEADYFATLRCMKQVGKTDAQTRAASIVLGKVLADLGDEPMPSPATPDKSIVDVTFEEHPAAQCRLDTYLHGYECKETGELSETNPRMNTCYNYETGIGVRPRCWFKP